MVEISSQCDKWLRRKTWKFCVDKQTNKQDEDVVQSTILAKSIKKNLTSKNFILIRWSVLHMQIWRHNEGTYDVIKKINLISHEEYLLCAKFQFFPWCSVRDIEVQSFYIFPTWLSHHVTYDIIIIIKTFHINSCTYGENFVWIWQAVMKKNTKVLCGQTNKQTDKQTNGLKCNTLSSGKGY